MASDKKEHDRRWEAHLESHKKVRLCTFVKPLRNCRGGRSIAQQCVTFDVVDRVGRQCEALLLLGACKFNDLYARAKCTHIMHAQQP